MSTGVRQSDAVDSEEPDLEDCSEKLRRLRDSGAEGLGAKVGMRIETFLRKVERVEGAGEEALFG